MTEASEATSAGEKDINAHPSERTILIPKHGDATRVETDNDNDSDALPTTPADCNTDGWLEQMKDTVLSLYTALGVLTYVALFILACIELYNGQRYRYGDRGCDQPDGRLFSVKTWLWIDGVVSIVAINAALGAVASGIFPGNTGLVALFIVVAAYSLFVVAWSIPGFIQLVEYSKACRVSDHHLWNVAMAAIVVHWVFVAVNSVFAAVSVFQTGGVAALISPLLPSYSSSSSSSSYSRCLRRWRRSCRRFCCYCRCCCCCCRRRRRHRHVKPVQSRITSIAPIPNGAFSPPVFDDEEEVVAVVVAAKTPLPLSSPSDEVGDDVPPRRQGRRRSKRGMYSASNWAWPSPPDV